ncbi:MULTISPECIES: WhiB family transcriptional regulator [unclassified Nocardiopsis]|uniref:WhiB family transcriptional regulator n=1 Tax=Nocardiopsis TaxID=2013 RepID=UPI00387B4500
MRFYRAAGARDQRTTAPATDWRDRAACRDQDTDLFFDDTGVGTERAKRTCAGCPALVPCREWALAAPERYGVWGGMDAEERKAERRNRQRRVAPTPGPAEKKPAVPRVPAAGTRRRLQALALAGHGTTRVCTAIGMGRAGHLHMIREGDAKTVPADLADAVRRILPVLLGTPPSVKAARGDTRAAAVAAGWLPAEAWDGVDIDDPDARPRQTTAA